MALKYLRDARHLAAKLLEHIAGLVAQRDLDKHQQAAAEQRGIQARVIAHDDAVALHAFDPLDAWRDGQADRFRQFLHRHAPVRLEQSQDLPIQPVQAAHGLTTCSH